MAYWKWNWQKDEWPNFSYNQEALKSLEYQFMQANGSLSNNLSSPANFGLK